jgi:coenzyme F420-0:L-glutamate ligase / coenzyme F420-1:gamma-L-glutamate ligase
LQYIRYTGLPLSSRRPKMGKTLEGKPRSQPRISRISEPATTASAPQAGGIDGELRVIPLVGIPLVQPGDDIASIIMPALQRSSASLREGDVVAIAQKIVSKSEGRVVDLRLVTPSPRARELAEATQKDARLVELILGESTSVLRHRPGVLIVVHRLGMVLANAGIDRSNVAGSEHALLLPRDPDRSAADIRDKLRAATGIDPGVVIIDSIGRAWRNGTVGTAIGASGIAGVLDLRGRPDLFGRRLETTELGFADEVAAAASLVMGQAGEGRPVALLRGLAYERREGTAREVLRARDKDLFQ